MKAFGIVRLMAAPTVESSYLRLRQEISSWITIITVIVISRPSTTVPQLDTTVRPTETGIREDAGGI